MSKDKKYVVVLKSGHVGERDLEPFASFTDAVDWMEGEFSQEEIEDNHIKVALDVDGERTYEF